MEENTNTPVQENAPVAEPQKKGNGFVVAALVLAIVSVILCWIPIIGWITWITSILAVIFGIIGLVKKQNKVMGIISLVLAVASWIILPLVVSSAASSVISLY